MLLLFLFVLFKVLPSLYYRHIVLINMFHGKLHMLFNQGRLGSRAGHVLFDPGVPGFARGFRRFLPSLPYGASITCRSCLFISKNKVF